MPITLPRMCVREGSAVSNSSFQSESDVVSFPESTRVPDVQTMINMHQSMDDLRNQTMKDDARLTNAEINAAKKQIGRLQAQRANLHLRARTSARIRPGYSDRMGTIDRQIDKHQAKVDQWKESLAERTRLLGK